MPGDSVGVEGDVVATAGLTYLSPADSGAWTPGPVSYQSYSQLAVGGVSVIYEAECTFNFLGANSAASGATVSAWR